MEIAPLRSNWRMAWNYVGVEIPMVKKFGSHSPHLHLKSKRHHQGEHIPMIEYKFPSSNVGANYPSYVSDPNRQ